jgi:hypothetical protein
MRRYFTVFAVVSGLVVGVAAVAVAGYEWRDHAAPFDFEFGNHIDTHQQTQEVGKGQLTGFLYITPSDKVTDQGITIAKHGDCEQDAEGCTVGWNLHGLESTASYCGHRSGEHPGWAIDPADMPRQPGYTHFHWLGEPVHHSGSSDDHTTSDDGLVVGTVYDGKLLKLTGVETFVFNHHGEFLVSPGIDFVTHANVFATCADWEAAGTGDSHG